MARGAQHRVARSPIWRRAKFRQKPFLLSDKCVPLNRVSPKSTNERSSLYAGTRPQRDDGSNKTAVGPDYPTGSSVRGCNGRSKPCFHAASSPHVMKVVRYFTWPMVRVVCPGSSGCSRRRWPALAAFECRRRSGGYLSDRRSRCKERDRNRRRGTRCRAKHIGNGRAVGIEGSAVERDIIARHVIALAWNPSAAALTSAASRFCRPLIIAVTSAPTVEFLPSSSLSNRASKMPPWAASKFWTLFSQPWSV